MRSKARTGVKRATGWPRLLVGLAAVLMTVPLMGGCTPDIQEAPPRPSRGSDEVDLSDQEFTGFEEADDYSRPDYPLRRNPFRPDNDVLGREEEEARDEDIRTVEPLEEYPLASLSLVTVMSETTVPKAMFVDPTGLGHFAKEGDRIGQRGGVIRSIRSNEVEVREGDGDSASRVTVRLRDQEIVGNDGDELTDEQREALREILESDEGQEILDGIDDGEEAPAREAQVDDRRFQGLEPPQR